MRPRPRRSWLARFAEGTPAQQAAKSERGEAVWYSSQLPSSQWPRLWREPASILLPPKALLGVANRQTAARKAKPLTGTGPGRR
jgi:hypothetical protein